MYKILIVFVLLNLILLAACTPAVTPTSQPSAASIAPTETATKKPKEKAAQPAPVATKIAKPKGGEQPSAPVSTNPNVIAPEILGRPTNNSITINVVPAQAMNIIVDYGTTAGVYEHQSAVSAPGGNPIEITLEQLQPNTRY